MTSLRTILGPCVCEKECGLASVNSQRIVLDLVNIVFVIVFYSSLLVVYVRKYGISENRYSKRDWISVLIASCCFITSGAYLGDCLWEVISRSRKFDCSDWVTDVGRVVIWTTLSFSLLIERSKLIKILVSGWWMLLFVSISVIEVEKLIEGHRMLVLEFIEWVVSFLLLFCALRNGKELVNQQAHETLLDPLLVNGTVGGNINQVEEPSFFSKLVFSWVNPLISLGYRKPLVLEDIPSLAPKDQAHLAYEQFKTVWDSLQREKTSNDVNLVGKALQRVYCKEMVVVGIYAFMRTVSVIIGPLLLYAFVNYSNREIENLQYGLLLVGCLIVVKMVESISQRHFFFSAKRIGMRMRSALMVAVYDKQLKLSSLGRKRHSTGEVVNYIGVDAYRMGEFPMWVHVAWTSFVQLFLAIGVLFFVVGVGVLPGLVPLLLCGILNIPFAISLQKCQLQFMIAQDKRLRSTSEILNNMKIIKLQSWEEKFKSFIESCRENEFKWLSDSQYQKAYGSVLYWISPTIVSSAVLCGCAFFTSAPLNTATIFTILATLRTMSEPVKYFPQALSILIQTKVSFDRINSFLVENELENDITMENQRQDDFGTCIKILQGNFSWDPESPFPTLRNINIEVTRGKKIVICGPVGAGKSSLLYAILREITRTSGTVDVFGSIAYVSQASWIQSGTIRDNILYGTPMDELRYENAINSCALDKDLNDFNHGDLTEIGQRGLNMSGGQKQRIQLARAVYNDADIYLLDDPFSAVDAHTAATLFNDCVMTALREKTVILVTHQVEFLSEVDNILVMEDGEITQSGKYEDLISVGTAFEQLVNAHKYVITDLESSYENKNKSKTSSVKETNSLNRRNEINEEISKESVQLTKEEEKPIGDVGWKPFLDYIIISKGGWFFFSSLLSQIGFSALQAAASYWLAFAVKIPKYTSFTLIGVYALISTTSAVFIFLRGLSTTLLGLKASKAFFSKFTESIFSAPMLFFDSTPVGRILTRASTDLSVVDFDIPLSFVFVVTSGVELLTIITVMTSVTWQVLVVGTFAIIAIKYFQGYYQPSARELIRINGTTKAPVVNYASETSLGVATIRAFRKKDGFFKNYLKLVDIDARTFIFTNATLEWLVLRVEALQNLTLFTAAFFLVLLPKGYIDPGLVGLSLSYALALTNSHVLLTRWYCSLTNYIISVERIKQYMQIPPEPPAVVENNRPLSSWPSKGRIELHNLKIRYRPNAPLVLKGITCTFKEGTRVGIVGRTGSGKTTLITALFRLVEPDSGKIYIDGLDICSVGLKDLRMKLSVIPQEPTLFKGSIRTNLDPLGLHSDDEIWTALEKCQLKSTITSLPNSLDSSVSDEGENWSMGQRQLFCLGRVLLKRNKILVLDEATASIDSDTDATVQRIIREEFSSCTVITVAHRIPTVIDSDMVMVLSFGKIMEYDEPSKLMESDSYFSKLVTEYWSSCRSTSTTT